MKNPSQRKRKRGERGEKEGKTNKVVAGVNEREKKSIRARNWNDRAVGLAMATADNKLSDDG